VDVKLDHVLTGVRVGRREEQDDGFIEQLAFFCHQFANRRMARSRGRIRTEMGQHSQ
jgi:hypothetical protein